MAAILKNQILKHLSKFTKNLTPEKINISTLKGEGELSNLELDEVILMDLLDLPTWMKLNKAVCNKVSLKIQWTKLKSQPICLYLDEVILEIETCTEPRPPNKPSHESSYRSGGRYGFVDKVIDGIFVHINSVSVNFKSQKFHASLQLSRVKVQSMSPTWCFPTDLRQSRIRNEPNDEILLFKEVDWQTTRIEATACDESMPSTPLRLIANQSKLRIVMKKRLSDCSSIASRVIFLLDDILWVLTDTQLKSAIMYANSLEVMIKKSTEQSKRLAADKLHKQGQAGGSGSDQYMLQQQQLQKPRTQTNEARYFQRYDVATTSYHLITSRIDLHLCDDSPIGDGKESSPNHNRLIDGGAMQITFCKLSLDVYPFHLAGGERKNWYRYTDNQGSRNSWVQDLFKAFREDVAKAREACKVVSPSQSPVHRPGTRSQHSSDSHSAKDQRSSKPRVTKLLESCIVLRVEEFIIYRVSTMDNKRSTPQKFFSSDKKALHLPTDMSVIHLEYTDYFFTEGIDYPVPHANLYILVNPVRLTLDYLTMLWANYFSLSLAQTPGKERTEMNNKEEHVDTKIEFLMPRVVMPVEEKSDKQSHHPESLQIQISRVTATNTHIENRFTLNDLRDLLTEYSHCDMFKQSPGPNETHDLQTIPKAFMDIANGHLNPYLSPYAKGLVKGVLPDGLGGENIDAIKLLMKTNTLKRDASCDIWAVCVDQVWMEFLGHASSRARPCPFVESVPITLWMYKPLVVPDGAISQSTSCSESLSSNSIDKSESDLEKRRQKRRLLKDYYSEESSEGADITDNEQILNNSTDQPKPADSSNTSDNCETGFDKDVQCTALKLADFNVVAKIGGKIRAQLNHNQYLSLLRLSDSFAEFLLQLNADVDDLSSSTESSASVSLPFVIPQLEFAMVCPYINEMMPFDHPLDVYNSPGSSDGRGRYGEPDMEIPEDVTGNQYGNYAGMNDQILTVTQYEDGSNISITDSLQADNVRIVHSQSDSTIVCHVTSSDGSHILPGEGIALRNNSQSSEDVGQSYSPSNHLETLGHAPQISGSDSGLSSMGSNFPGQRPRTSSKLTPNMVKKSFAVGMQNFVGKIKNKLDPDDFEDDSVSLKTDTSDDDFEYLSMDENEAPAFIHHNRSETVSEADTDDLSSVFAESASKVKEAVSVIVFRLSRSELLIQKKDDDMTFRLHARCIDTEEMGNIIYEDFYAKLSSPNGIINHAADLQDRTKYPLKFKYSKGPGAEKVVPRGNELGMMDIGLRDLVFKISNPSLTYLSNFVEDETPGTPIPMHVTVHGLSLVLTDNCHQETNIPPVTMNISNLFINRYSDGIFHIQPGNHQQNHRQNLVPEWGKRISGQTAFSKETNDLMKVNDKDVQVHNHAVVDDSRSSDESRVNHLENQNQQLRILLDKLDNYSQEQDAKLEELQNIEDKFDDLTRENDLLQKQLRSFAGVDDASLDRIDLKKVKDELELDNAKLAERVVTLEDELETVKKEKDSLVSTLNLLQGELMSSEQRHRYRQGHDI